MKTKIAYGIRRKRCAVFGERDFDTIEKAREELRQLKVGDGGLRLNLEPYIVKITVEPIE